MMDMRKILFPIYTMAVKLVSRKRFGRLYPIKMTHQFLKRLLRPNVVIVQGNKMFLDPSDILSIAIHGIWEPLTTEFINKEIKNGDVVLDLGANIGYFTLILAKLVGPNGKVFAFEPDPGNLALLEKNIKLNNLHNVILVPKAVSNETGKVQLYLYGDDKPRTTTSNLQNSHQSIEVESTTLDDYFKDYNGQIDFIKIDIEGAEGKAIQGASSLLEKNKNLKMVVEFSPFHLKASGIGAEEHLNLLSKHGFIFYDIDEKKDKIESVTIEFLLKTYTPENENYTNLLCLREG